LENIGEGLLHACISSYKCNGTKREAGRARVWSLSCFLKNSFKKVLKSFRRVLKSKNSLKS
jgi:hypothetical protein